MMPRKNPYGSQPTHCGKASVHMLIETESYLKFLVQFSHSSQSQDSDYGDTRETHVLFRMSCFPTRAVDGVMQVSDSCQKLK